MAVRLAVRHPRSAAGEAGEINFEFEQPRIVLGRSAGADVRLPGRGVSETHATIERVGSQYALRDEGSTNGTRINGAPIVPSRPRLLAHGDEIAIAEFVLHFFEGAVRRELTPPERTASLARRMLRELLDDESAAREPPFLRVVEGPDQGTLINLGEPPSRLVIGRGEGADLVLRDVDVSRAHLELVRDLDGTTARDLGSKNGLEVNGKRMRERRLRHGDVIRVGASAIVYQDLAEQALRDLERQPDLTLTHTQTRPQDVVEEPPPAPANAPLEPPAVPVPQERPNSALDLLVYALALVVLVASVVGLVWLFG